MKNLKYIILIISVLLVSSLVVYGVLFFNKGHKTFESTLKIKEEYESLNGTARENGGETYQDVKIDESIEINILDINSSLDFIKNNTGILFIGAPWCPWCRNALPVLMEVAKENNLVINYLDITDIRNVYEIKDNKLIKTQEEKDGYYELLDALDEILGDDTYKLTAEDGKIYDTKEKRIYIPTTIAIKNGSIEGVHVSTVNLNENQSKYDPLTKEQIKELKSIYQELINKTKGLNVCNEIDRCD